MVYIYNTRPVCMCACCGLYVHVCLCQYTCGIWCAKVCMHKAWSGYVWVHLYVGSTMFVCLGMYVHPIHEPVTSLKDWYRLHVTMCLYLYRNLHRPMGRLGWLCGSALSLKHVRHVYSGFCVCSHETPGMPLCLKH